MNNVAKLSKREQELVKSMNYAFKVMGESKARMIVSLGQLKDPSVDVLEKTMAKDIVRMSQLDMEDMLGLLRRSTEEYMSLTKLS